LNQTVKNIEDINFAHSAILTNSQA